MTPLITCHDPPCQVRYHVEIDLNGEVQLGTFGATAGKIGTTIAHTVFGVGL